MSLISKDCASRLVGYKLALLDYSESLPDFSGVQPELPRITVPSTLGFTSQGSTCSEACTFGIIWNYAFEAWAFHKNRKDEDACRVCLRGMFGIVHSGSDEYPTTEILRIC